MKYIFNTVLILIGIMSVVVFMAYDYDTVHFAKDGEVISAEIQPLPRCKSADEIRAALPHIPPIYGYGEGETIEEVVMSEMFAQTPTTCDFTPYYYY